MQGHPTVFDRAHDRLVDALRACDRLHLTDALAFIHDARRLLETEEGFRDARRPETVRT